MSKRTQSASPAGQRSPGAPPVLFPLVMSVPEANFKFTDVHFADLERAGDVTLSEKQRVSLCTLADFWIGDLRARRTARPKAFRKCLEDVIGASLRLERVCQWDGQPMYHLVHWAMETNLDGAQSFLGILASAEQEAKRAREMAEALKKCLPPDPGRQRPFDDERRMFALADAFEAAGGKAAIYSSDYEEGGIADTPFRRFAQLFYSFLPADDKREPGGLDEAFRLAMLNRSAA